jgi:hypothetical protein
MRRPYEGSLFFVGASRGPQKTQRVFWGAPHCLALLPPPVLWMEGDACVAPTEGRSDVCVLLFGDTRRESDRAACESRDITSLCPNSNTPAAKGWAVSRASFEARSLMLARASG